MSGGIYAALSGAIAHSISLEATATNLANASTDGYRAVRPVFHEVLAKQQGAAKEVKFAAIRRTTVDPSTGAIKATGRALDIVLPKNAFLAIETPNGERYTRAGSLQVSSEGLLTTKSGDAVLSEAKTPISVDLAEELTITENGEVMSGETSVGFLGILSFDDPRQMTYEGSSRLAADPRAGEPKPNDELIKVGQLEESNATPVRAMSELMMATRMFDAMQRAISTFKDIDQRLVSTVPKG